jgi:ATPase subunit of ABC transporter with duplicated ATPase domains
MTLLTLKDAGITLGAPLFTRLDLTLQPGDRLGLVAPNGRGKSTLLSVLAGRAELTEGKITRRRGLVTGILAQDVPEALSGLTAREVVLGAVPEDEDHFNVRTGQDHARFGAVKLARALLESLVDSDNVQFTVCRHDSSSGQDKGQAKKQTMQH